MKKILYITTVSSTINAFLVPHIKQLIDDGNIVDCASSKNRGLDKELINLGVEFFEVSFTRNPLDLKNIVAFKQLIKIQKEKEYDIVHVHTPIAALYGRLLKVRFPKLRTIYTAHGFHFYKGAPKKNWIIYYPIEKLMAKFTDTIITMNEEDYNQALKFNIKNTHKINGVGLDLSKYNSNLFDRNAVRKELGLNEDDFVILMIAEVNKNKNHIQMVKAIELLKSKGIEVKVLCAGKGPLQEYIENEIHTRGLESNIYMLGFRNDIPKLITACDIGMLLSYREGLPRNIMELMAYGKPVIGTDIRGIKDLVKNNKTGYVIEVGDYMSLANKISILISDNSIIERMSNIAFENIIEYDIENILSRLKQIY